MVYITDAHGPITYKIQLITSKIMKFVAKKVVHNIIGKAMHNKRKVKSNF